MRDRFIKIGINIGLGTGMSISLALGMMHLFKLEIDYLQIFLMMCVLQVVCVVVFSSKKTSLSFFAICSMLIGLLYLGLQTRWAYIIYKILVYLRHDIDRWKLLLMGSIGVGIYLLTCKFFKKNILIGTGIILYSILIIKDTIFNDKEVAFFLFISLLYIFYAYFLELIKEEKSTKATDRSYFKSIIYVCVSTLCFTLGASYLAPIKFTALHRLLDKKRIYEAEYSYSRYYPYSGMLGGDIVLGDEEVLEVMATEGTYLKADSKSIYTGTYWTNVIETPTAMDLSAYQIEDTVEMLEGMSLLTKADEEELYKEQTFKITFKNLITKSLFIPIKSDNLVVAQHTADVYKKNDDTLTLGKAYGPDFTYSMHAYIPKYNTPEFKLALSKSKRGLYKEYATSGKNKLGKLSLVELEKRSLRAEEIYTTFTKLPDDLPERVKDLAYEITKEYTSDYDKARALESYLAGNYIYTLSPGDPTKGQDFVDEFLFDTKKGYCTYFATAMAVLSRSIGLPSRYVEGYTMPVAYQGSGSTYTITSKQAHAWTEIYFEGFGWMIFEPTARYQSSFRRNPGGTGDSYYKPEIVEQMEELEVNEPIIFQGENRNIYHIFKLSLFLIGMGTLSVLIVIICYRNKRFKKMAPRSFILKCYEIDRNKLAKKGLKLEKGETELTFARRVDESLKNKLKNKVSFVEITKLYLIARYSENEMKEEQKKEMYALHTSLRKLHL